MQTIQTFDTSSLSAQLTQDPTTDIAESFLRPVAIVEKALSYSRVHLRLVCTRDAQAR